MQLQPQNLLPSKKNRTLGVAIIIIVIIVVVSILAVGSMRGMPFNPYHAVIDVQVINNGPAEKDFELFINGQSVAKGHITGLNIKSHTMVQSDRASGKYEIKVVAEDDSKQATSDSETVALNDYESKIVKLYI